MKKTLSLILALLMGVSCASGIFAEEVMPIDAIAEDGVVENADYSEAAAFLDHYEIMKGKGEGDLALEDAVKRYEMALLVARVSTGWLTDTQWINGDANDSEFTDLAGTGAEACYGALSYANQKGIVIGYGDGTFKPEKGVSYRDALTMAVRTLGYTNGLDYPWDYIEKAVALGLTDKIDGVAYTEEINRGVVAQIVYNMMFAAKQGGSTLAMDIFGIEFGWENIMITANTRGVYEAGAEETKEGVAFKVVLKDGTLDENVYYVDGDYELGRIYKALFEIDDEDDFVTLYTAKAYDAALIENKGLTDDAEVAYDDVYPINTYLEDYTLVTKYNVKNLANAGKLNNEIIVADAYTKASVLTIKDDVDSPYAIDWTSGNILLWDDEAETYEIAWYYNEKFEYFFRLGELDSTINGEDALVGIEIMDEDDIADIKDAIAEALKEYVEADSFALLEKAPGKAAYAALEVYDFNEDGFGDYAIYESYKLGKFSNCEVKCSDCDKKYAGYKFEDLKVGELTHVNGDAALEVQAATCDHCDASEVAVFVEGFEPTTEGYVIYGWNDTTKEAKIIKEIAKLGENTDADSYWTTGIVRGYSMTNKTVTIDNDNITFDYPNLDGTAFVAVKDNKPAYTDYFDRLFNQFVKYLVVDGVVVYIETVGDTTDEYIVVDAYYGIDSDNKIVVAGYSTKDLKYDTFRIESFNGWKNGDFFFYREAIEDEFTKGTVYQITSHDVENDLYFVESLSYFSTRVPEDEEPQFVRPPFDTESVVDVEGTFATVEFLEGNYRVVTVDNETKTLRMEDTDKYIIIGDPESKLINYMPIYVYEGKLEDGWFVAGDIIVGDAGSRTLVIANPVEISGFNRDTYDTGYVVVLDNKILDRNYNGYGKDYYIYGATTNTVEVFNLITAKSDEVRYNTNLELEEGFIYRTISDTIVSDEDLRWWEFMEDMVVFGYQDQDAETAKYFTQGTGAFLETWLDKETFSEEYISSNAFGLTNGFGDLVDGLTVMGVTLNDNGTVASIDKIDADAWDEIEEEAEATIESMPAFVIYEFATEKAVVYLDLNNVNWTKSYEAVVDAENVAKIDNFNENAYVALQGLVSATETDDGLVDVKLNGLTVYFTGEATEDVHKAIEDKNYYFGYRGDCKKENWQLVVDAKKYYGSIDAYTYGECESCVACDAAPCELVKAVTFTFDAIDITADATTKTVEFKCNIDGYEFTYTFDFTVELDGDEIVLDCTNAQIALFNDTLVAFDTIVY